MTTTGPEDNNDFDFFAAETHAAIENLAGRSTFPVVDCERETTCHLIDDFGVIETHHEPTDEFHALAVRLTFGGSGFQIEIGEYNFSERQIDVLRRALVAYYSQVTEPPLR